MTYPGEKPEDLDDEPWEPEVVELPIDGTLDLHGFNPRDVKDLVPEYLTECRERGILEVRVVHGKGTGTLRRTVQAILGRLPFVRSHKLAGHGRGGWGATLVDLAPLDEER
jgi:DNA-nicking Smr family endonuclease